MTDSDREETLEEGETHRLGHYLRGPVPVGEWIECKVCNNRSHNPEDVLTKYCANCRDWHSGLVEKQKKEVETRKLLEQQRIALENRHVGIS